MKLSDVLNHQHWIIRFEAEAEGSTFLEWEIKQGFFFIVFIWGNPKLDKFYILLGNNFWKQVWDKNGMLDINNSEIKLLFNPGRTW